MTRSQRGFRWVGVAAACIAAALVIASWPVATRVGLNYQLSSKRVPLYEKVINFLSRDLQTRRLAKEIVAGASTDEEKLLKIFSWVTEHVRPTPPGFPVVDDHILHTIIRGYGADDQRAEAFVVLAGYAGLRGRVVRLEPPSHPNVFLYVALVTSGAHTYVFDITNRVIFRDERGRLADLEVLSRNPRLIAAAAPGLVVEGIPYQHYFLGLRQAKTWSRTDAQQLWPRLTQELRRAWHGVLGREARGSVK
jgi:hypothetical protein